MYALNGASFAIGRDPSISFDSEVIYQSPIVLIQQIVESHLLLLSPICTFPRKWPTKRVELFVADKPLMD
jgi:hypothetical protein